MDFKDLQSLLFRSVSLRPRAHSTPAQPSALRQTLTRRQLRHLSPSQASRRARKKAAGFNAQRRRCARLFNSQKLKSLRLELRSCGRTSTLSQKATTAEAVPQEAFSTTLSWTRSTLKHPKRPNSWSQGAKTSCNANLHTPLLSLVPFRLNRD